MCTLSHVFKQDSLWVGFNRDEQLSRQRGIEPKEYVDNGVRYLCPLDGQSQGTWIGVNEFGLIVCLLNFYDKMPHTTLGSSFKSRGALVKDVLSVGSFAHATAFLHSENLKVYMPFRLVLLTLKHGVSQWAWDGHSLVSESLENPVVSSSFDVVGCRGTRSLAFEQLDFDSVTNFDDVLRYHASHFPVKGPLSVCVHRPDVETVSFTGVRLTSTVAEMVYTDGTPCSQPLSEPVFLKL